jgi:hypothetical protein
LLSVVFLKGKALNLIETEIRSGNCMKCRITYNGRNLAPSVAVHLADRNAFFSKSNKLISIKIDNITGYTTLQPDFFTHVSQIRTVYPTKEYRAGQNLLVKWVRENKLEIGDEVELDVIVPFKQFRLRKV